MKIKLKKALPLFIVTALSLIGFATPQIDIPMLGESTGEQTDSVIPPDTLFERAAESYKQLKFMKFDGAPDDAVYPAAFKTYETLLTAIEAVEPMTSEHARCKEMLRDVDNDLFKGAFHYSARGDQRRLTTYAQAFIDIQEHPAFKGDVWNRTDPSFPTLAYIAASGAYNAQAYERAIKYFQVYFATGDQARRENVYMFMGQACFNSKQYELCVQTMTEGSKAYPDNSHILLIGIQACVDGGLAEHLQHFLTRALALKPTDEQLLNLQGQLYEDDNEYEKAIGVYTTLDALRPNNLSVAKHIGLDYYNMAVGYFNQAINEKDEKLSRRNRRQAKNYFDAAADKFRLVLASDPMNVKYLRALGVCYLCLEDKLSFGKINEQLIALGADALDEVFMPPLVNYAEGDKKNLNRSGSVAGKEIEAPFYSDFARDYITKKIEEWSKKDEFEKPEDYLRRVNEESIRIQYARYNQEAADEYLKTYGPMLRLTNLSLQPYDAANETFLIESSYGPMHVHVPIADNEAELFKSSWNGVRFKTPKYFIENDQVAIASVTFVMPNGKQYTYDNKQALDYAPPVIEIELNKIISSGAPVAQNNNTARRQNSNRMTITKKSDVDENIPVTRKVASNTLALVIANENYKNVGSVPSSHNDGTVFADYCRLTLGIPESNISLYKDASLAQTLEAMTDLRNKVDALGGNADVIVYYAGHGMPDEQTKDAYLLPVDGNPMVMKTNYPLSDFYGELGNMKAQSVVVFMDACFSGARRDGDMLMSARSVVLKPKETTPVGNTLVLSAASGNETAMPYTEQNHGLFTYYLLQKLQKSNGNTTLKELCDYVIDNVKKQSNFINHKPQTPTAVTSGLMTSQWHNRKLRP